MLEILKNWKYERNLSPHDRRVARISRRLIENRRRESVGEKPKGLVVESAEGIRYAYRQSELTVGETRGEFIENVYPKLFGEEEMGDVSREFRPSEITAILVAYESRLASNGLLKIVQQREQ